MYVAKWHYSLQDNVWQAITIIPIILFTIVADRFIYLITSSLVGLIPLLYLIWTAALSCTMQSGMNDPLHSVQIYRYITITMPPCIEWCKAAPFLPTYIQYLCVHLHCHWCLWGLCCEYGARWPLHVFDLSCVLRVWCSKKLPVLLCVFVVVIVCFCSGVLLCTRWPPKWWQITLFVVVKLPWLYVLYSMWHYPHYYYYEWPPLLEIHNAGYIIEYMCIYLHYVLVYMKLR